MVNLKVLLVFGLTASLVVFLGYDFLKPAFDIGLTPEDREFILRYKLLGPNPLSKIFQVWSERGAYTTGPIYYIGIVQSIAGFNYQQIQFISVLFRTLAILSIFPLVVIVFRNIWLAVLTTIIFAFSYTTTGALETGVEPSEYLGLFMMNIFLIAYYFLNTKYLLKLGWLILTSLLLFVAVITSVMRVFPLLFLLPLVEMFLWILNRKKYKFKYLLIKLIVLYMPFLVLNYFSPVSTSGLFSLPTILSKMADGNWQLLLTPIQGLGFIIPLSKHYSLMGVLNLNNFKDYLGFLLGGPLVIFGIGSFLLSWISSKRPFYLFLRIFSLNFGLDLLVFWVIQHRLSVPLELRLDYDMSRLYSVFFGLFILTLGVNYFIEWYRQGKKNNLSLTIWLGSFIALFYITTTYLYANLNLSFGGAQDHYLLIPTFGVSLLIAGILLLLQDKLSNLKFGFIISTILIVSILSILYGLNKELTHDYFDRANIAGRAASGQIEMQIKIRQKLKDIDYTKSLLVYFDASEISDDGPFYSESLLTPFPSFMHLDGEKVLNGCIGVIYENSKMVQLRKLIKETNNQLVVEHTAVCVDGYSMSTKDISIRLDDLYAYKIKDKDFIDIKDQVLKELNFK